QGETAQRYYHIIPKLKEYAEGLGNTLARLAVRWVLDQPGEPMALWGARRPGQIAEAAGVLGWQLTPEQLAEIDRIVSETESPRLRGRHRNGCARRAEFHKLRGTVSCGGWKVDDKRARDLRE